MSYVIILCGKLLMQHSNYRSKRQNNQAATQGCNQETQYGIWHKNLCMDEAEQLKFELSLFKTTGSIRRQQTIAWRDHWEFVYLCLYIHT